MKQVKRPPKESEEESGIPEKVSKMAIGVEGGFKSDVKKDEYDDVNEIVIVPSFQRFSIGKHEEIICFPDCSGDFRGQMNCPNPFTDTFP